MWRMKAILIFVLWLSSGNILAQVGQQPEGAKSASLDAEAEKHALEIFLKLTEKLIVSAADAMPADKYGFAPTDAEFTSVPTSGHMVKPPPPTTHIPPPP